MTLTGSGFIGTTSVDFGVKASAHVMVNSDTSITATSPAGTGTVSVTVTGPGGTSTPTGSDPFIYVAGFQITTAALPAGTKGQLYNGSAAGLTLQTAEAQPGASLKWKKLAP